MNSLPKGWKFENLVGLCNKDKKSIRRGPFGGSLKKEIFVNSGYKIYEQKHAIENNFTIGHYYITKEKYEEMKSFSVKPGDIIISCSGTIGKIAIIPPNAEEGIINQALLKLSLDKNKVLTKYFIYLFESDLIQKKLTKISRGVAIKNVPSVKDLKLIAFPIPPTIEEQQKIVDEIETQFTRLDASVKDLKNIGFKLEIYINSLIQSALQGKLIQCANSEESTNELFNRIKREKNKLIFEKKIRKEKEFSKIDLKEIPFETSEKWMWVRLGEIVSILGDGLHGTPKYSDRGDYAFINGNNLDDGKIIIKENTKLVSKEEYLKYKKDLNENTILVSINGTLGNVALYSDEKVVLGKSACYFNTLNGINKEYIKLLIQSKYFLNYAYKNATGSTIKNVSLRSMRLLILPLPPTTEQNTIVEKMETFFSIIDKVKEAVNSSLLKAEQLRKSILKSAFEGKLVKYNAS